MKFRVYLPVFLCAAASVAGAQQAQTPSQEPNGKVIFSRSLDENTGNVSSATKHAEEKTSAIPGGAVTDVERQDITFLSYDFDVHLHPRQNAMAVRVQMTLRNDGTQPLHRLPLQISSSLSWAGIRVEGKEAHFVQHAVASDTDHTGELHEAVVALPHPLAPKQSIQMDASYEGTIDRTSQRLQQIGTPADIADRSDWDRVSENFTGVRGFGDVVWYPVVSTPVALGDGDKFFTEVASQRLRQSGAIISMNIVEEFFGAVPNLAILDGKQVAVTPASMPVSAALPGIATCTLPKTRLGFSTPNFFLLTRTKAESKGLQIFTQPENTANVEAYQKAADLAQALLVQWLGPHPKSEFTIVDLPEPGDNSFEDGPLIFTSLQADTSEKLAGALVHPLTHAWFESPYAWLQEGVASFMESLWVEQKRGRDVAIAELDNARSALSLAEPQDPGPELTGSRLPVTPGNDPSAKAETGEALLGAKEPIFYETKATYVFWMLRDVAGDDVLAKAFHQYEPTADTEGTQFEQLLERISRKDLKWFFSDWVYRDRGLPDLSIAGVYPNAASIPGSYIVSVDISNSGYAEAEVPVSVRSSATTITERLRIPSNSKVTHRFLLQGQPIEVAVNDGTVPEVEASVHRRTISDR